MDMVQNIARTDSEEWFSLSDDIVIGKDILELLSSAMYIDPMTIFREYVQNAADAIDSLASRSRGPAPTGRIDIYLDPTFRSIRIRDNGEGVSKHDFVRRLSAFGASEKRGSNFRGFRGVGRLAGLGYCRELIFRTRAPGDSEVSEMRWDCRILRSILQENSFTGTLTDLVRAVVKTRYALPGDWPEHFFEVEMKGVTRHRNDQLLNDAAVGSYLAQIAPVSFSPEFSFRDRIDTFLKAHLNSHAVEIWINNSSEPVHRPHRDSTEGSNGNVERFSDFETFTIPGVDGGTAAIGWVLHHGYTGALPSAALIKGLRFRSGDIQVGGDDLVQDLFTEPRFNSWSVGEVHMIDRRITPNGRRDHYEQNVHYDNVLTHLAPVLREISRRCRTSSIERRWLREFERNETAIKEHLLILGQRSSSPSARKRAEREIRGSLVAMDKIVVMDAVEPDKRVALGKRLKKLRLLVDGAAASRVSDDPYAFLPPNRREAYVSVIDLIYECSANRVAAKSLVDKILAKLRTAAELKQRPSAKKKRRGGKK